ncbi:hypothetical protein [Paenibacillus sp. FSL W8-0194]|uniref:hypothetical protein n=1 Tax=Paenibacillus sp. FSL W8-0194 TaxID=2921711 RepID=UPI0030DBC485
MNNNKRGHHGFIHEVAKNRYLYLLALPGMLFLLVFAYTPMLGHLLAFQNYRLSDGLLGSQWVGWRNFEFFFSTNDWLRVTWNTVFLNGLFLVFGRYHIHDPRLSVEASPTTSSCPPNIPVNCFSTITECRCPIIF